MKTQPADFLSSMKENIQNRRGATGAFMADQFEKYQWGVKLPHLMAEYLFGLNVIPMPSLIELAGMPGSCKSTFLQWLMRVFAEQGMNAQMLETEGKMSWTLVTSILQEYSERVLLTQGPMSQEEWMGELMNSMKLYRQAYATSVDLFRKGKGELLKPFLVGLDSLGGAPSEDAMEKTDKDKAVGRSFPIEALKNSKFFPQIPVRLRDLPMVIVYTNHEQERIVEQKGPMTIKGPRSSQGGHRPGFFCGLRLFFEQATQMKNVGGLSTQVIKIEVVKNSFGEKGHVIGLPMCWKVDVDEETGKDYQTTWFDWHSTLTNFLVPPGKIEPRIPKSVLKQVLTLERPSEAKVNCRELGLVNASPAEVGEAIESDPELVARLRPLMGIKTWKVWDGKPIIDSVKDTLDMADPDLNVTAEEASGYDGGSDE